MQEDDNGIDYDELRRRIDQAKKNPLFGITKDDVQELTRIWMDSYNNLKKTNRRTIAENLNYPELLKLIAKHTHIKTRTGFLVYIGATVVSILGGEGAFCDELTYEIAVVDQETNTFITESYEPTADFLQASLHYQDIGDIEKIFDWCQTYKKGDNS